MTGRVHLDWGVAGARHLPDAVSVTVVVDVLSFTTTLGIACERGITVLPYRHEYESAQGFADENVAVLARRRRDADPHSISLSPGSVRRHRDPPARLVLPSPNGSAISHLLRDAGSTVMAASLRNADAVAELIATSFDDATVAMIAAGEQWEDGSLRPAAEDLWGVGAVLEGLVTRGRTNLSPEALSALHAWRGVAADAETALLDTVSGRELDSIGFVEDVRIAGEIGGSDVVPVMDGAAYRPAQ